MLKTRLSAYGICGNLISWISDFLTGRTQQTKTGATLSQTVSLVSGIVQGGVIGRLLFLLFVNDVVAVLTTRDCTLYADDHKLHSTLNADSDTLLLVGHTFFVIIRFLSNTYCFAQNGTIVHYIM
jgi:ribonuclease P/MRP protein subunit RPP40